MSRAALALLLAAGAVAGARVPAGHAQAMADLDLGAGVVKAADRASDRLGLLTGRAGVAGRRWHAAAVGSLALLQPSGTATYAAGTLAGWLPLSPAARLKGELGGGEGTDLGRRRSAFVRGAASLEVGTGWAHLRIGASHARAWLPESHRRVAGLGVAIVPRAGRLGVEGGATLLRLDERPEMAPPGGGERRWVGDLTLTARWRCGRCELTLRGRWRPAGRQQTMSGPEAALTGTAEAGWWFADQVALVLTGGSTPADAERGIAPVSSLRAGVRIGWRRPRRPPTRAAPPAIAPEGPDAWRLRLVRRDAARLYLRGDFSRWEPVPLERVGSDAWITPPLRRVPGVWRIQMSEDGRTWTPVPGLPRGSAEYGAEASVLIIPPG